MSLFKQHFTHLSLVLILGAAMPSMGQYTLTVEEAPATTVAGTTYSLYVNMQDPTDRMSAVFGNNQSQLEISAPDGVFNSTFNSSWSAHLV